MNVSSILITVDGHTPDTHLSAGSEDPDGDLPSVGHQYTLDGSGRPALAAVVVLTGREVRDQVGG